MLYDYDAQGNLQQTTDAMGNQITLGYDLLGRRTSLDDPDLGLSTFIYKNQRGQSHWFIRLKLVGYSLWQDSLV